VLTRILSIALGIAIIVMFAAPFARDAYHRYEVAKRLNGVLDERDRVAFNQWNGDAASFAKSLYERCELEQGHGASACERYRFAFR
jgi:hypothetical protein